MRGSSAGGCRPGLGSFVSHGASPSRDQCGPGLEAGELKPPAGPDYRLC